VTASLAVAAREEQRQRRRRLFARRPSPEAADTSLFVGEGRRTRSVERGSIGMGSIYEDDAVGAGVAVYSTWRLPAAGHNKPTPGARPCPALPCAPQPPSTLFRVVVHLSTGPRTVLGSPTRRSVADHTVAWANYQHHRALEDAKHTASTFLRAPLGLRERMHRPEQCLSVVYMTAALAQVGSTQAQAGVRLFLHSLCALPVRGLLLTTPHRNSIGTRPLVCWASV
jgi:hypothetical protein